MPGSLHTISSTCVLYMFSKLTGQLRALHSHTVRREARSGQITIIKIDGAKDSEPFLISLLMNGLTGTVSRILTYTVTCSPQPSVIKSPVQWVHRSCADSRAGCWICHPCQHLIPCTWAADWVGSFDERCNPDSLHYAFNGATLW